MATNAPSILRHDAPATVVSAVRWCGSAPTEPLRVLVHEASKELVSTSVHLHVFELVEPGVITGAS